MKPKQLIPDPNTFLQAGFRSLRDCAVLVHLGRCGLNGCTVEGMAAAVRAPYNTIYASLQDLAAEGWLLRYGRANSRGRKALYVVTKKGWALLTTPPELEMFPDALREGVR